MAETALQRSRRLDVLVAGGGVAGLEAALALQALGEERVEVEIVSPEEEFAYRPTSVAEAFGAGETRRFPLQQLVELAGARLTHGVVAEVKPERGSVITAGGDELSWDALLLALGAQPEAAIPGALTFAGPADTGALEELLHEARTGRVERIAFVLPAGTGWPLPLYELALMAQTHLADAGAAAVELVIVTPEPQPLASFGDAATQALSELLASRAIGIRTHTSPVSFDGKELSVVPGEPVAADRVVALPALRGPSIAGVPHDEHGFVPTDEHGRVPCDGDVFAAGDLTTFPIKQGGIATQQADAAAAAIAGLAGASVEPEPFRPVLRGLLLTGLTPRYLRADVLDGSSTVDAVPLWWPPAKIVGRHLAPFLARHLGLSERPPPGLEGALPVELELERAGGGWTTG